MRSLSEIIDPYPQETKDEVCRILVDYVQRLKRDEDKIIARMMDLMRQQVLYGARRAGE